MIDKHKTSYLKRLESYISQTNLALKADNSRLSNTADGYEKNEFDEKRLQSKEDLTTEQVKNKPEADGDIVSRTEKIFGVKATKMTDEEIKIHSQVADKALVYKVINGKPEILVYKNHD